MWSSAQTALRPEERFGEAKVFRQLLLAWRQLTFQKMRFVVALCGVLFANLLMFMQFGFQDALFDSATAMQRHLQADLVLLNPQTTSIYFPQVFSRRLLLRLLAHPNVESVHPLYLGSAPWKNPWTGQPRMIFVLGIDVYQPTLALPGLAENLAALRQTDAGLFDALSRREFGPVGEHLRAGESVEVEVNRRRLRMVGEVRLGPSFAADGNLILGQSNFLRLFPERKAGSVDVGLVRLKAGSDPEQIAAQVQQLVGKELRVLSGRQFVQFERAYWEGATAIGFIFTQGVLMGFLVGFVIVTQILYMDVTTHLPQYATLKAIGFTGGYLMGVVLFEGLILSTIGYLPGIALSAAFYQWTAEATNLPMVLQPGRAVQIFALTLCMCSLAGLLAMRKLASADPADVF